MVDVLVSYTEWFRIEPWHDKNYTVIGIKVADVHIKNNFSEKLCDTILLIRLTMFINFHIFQN